MSNNAAPQPSSVTLSDLYAAGMTVVDLVNDIEADPPSNEIANACADLSQEVAIAARHLRAYGAIPTPDPVVGATSNAVLQDVTAQLKKPPAPLTIKFLQDECHAATRALNDAYDNVVGADRSYALRVLKLYSKLPAGLTPTMPGIHAKVARDLAAALAASKKSGVPQKAAQKTVVTAKITRTKNK